MGGIRHDPDAYERARAAEDKYHEMRRGHAPPPVAPPPWRTDAMKDLKPKAEATIRAEIRRLEAIRDKTPVWSRTWTVAVTAIRALEWARGGAEPRLSSTLSAP